MEKQRRLYFAAACALAFVYGCSDDANISGKIIETCTISGEAKCTTEGVRVICENGIFVPNPCGENEGCFGGECTRKCDISTYPTSCDGNDRLYCGSNGLVARETCANNLVCKNGACQAEGTGGDIDAPCVAETFVNGCANGKTALVCENGKITSVPCKDSQVCSNGKCEDSGAPTKCDETTYKAKCNGTTQRIVCENGNETSQSCQSGEICQEGTCTSSCTGDLKICDGIDKAISCVDGKITVVECQPGQSCADGTCGTTCSDDYKACTNDQSSRLFCLNGIIHSEQCTDGMKCDRDTGKCALPQSGSECKEDVFSPACDANGQTIHCVNGFIEKKSCGENQTCYLGECVDSAPCAVSTYTPSCVGQNAIKVCKDAKENIEACAEGMICENGVCQTLSTTPECENGEFACVSQSIAKKCENGVWHQYTCQNDTQVCNSGKCTNIKEGGSSLTPCTETTFAASCDANTRIICEYGYESKYECGKDQHCDSGICYDNIKPGDACNDATFVAQCFEDGTLATCLEGKIQSSQCDPLVCAAGACVACNDTNFTASCTDSHLQKVCKDGQIVEQSCPIATHCESGACVPNPTPGQACNKDAFTAYCDSQGKHVECINNTVVVNECPASTPYCLLDTCVQCNPADGTKCVATTGAAQMTTCSESGVLTTTSCAPEQTTCFNNQCAACDPNTYTRTCNSESEIKICNDKGEITTDTCQAGYICEDGDCRKACATNAECGDHYICNAEKKCEFVPECTNIGALQCRIEGGVSVVQKCVGKGLWETQTTCLANEICGKADATDDLICRGTECSGTSASFCKGNAPAKCENGKYKAISSDCTGDHPVCISGTCKPCQYGVSTGICKDQADKTVLSRVCQPDNTYKDTVCQSNENCTDRGCVSKCGESFKTTCKDNRSINTCSDTGVQTVIQCNYNEVCVDGACKTRQGEACDWYKYDNQCIEDSEGNVYLEYCDKDKNGIQYRSCNTSDSQFCGTLDSRTGCFMTCTEEGSTYCHYYTGVQLGETGPCLKGKTYEGNDILGIRQSAGYCKDAFAVSCHIATTGDIIFNHFYCPLLNSTTNTCDAQTGACTDFATASCAAPSASCSGGKAINCLLDPASVSTTNANGYVQTVEDCSQIKGADGTNSVCTEYTFYGVKTARCALTQTLQYSDGSKKTTSTLGTCTDNKIHQLFKTNDGWTTWTHDCNEKTCTTGTASNGQSYAYCK